jgi:hypothetical protein
MRRNGTTRGDRVGHARRSSDDIVSDSLHEYMSISALSLHACTPPACTCTLA